MTVTKEDEAYAIACEVATMEFAELATLTYPQIGSISSISELGEPIMRKLATASTGELGEAGPFSRAADYFPALGNAAANNPTIRLGAFVFLDIVKTTGLFGSTGAEGSFPLNYIDLSTQNILVDRDFNFVTVIT
ncbi:hypothetical protein GGS24DRAFT_503884 [Hypoxylon argillaceum]|nr:hypothetical protein GGS24DRAFT_503884 [Hypoxylon argillaceum]